MIQARLKLTARAIGQGPGAQHHDCVRPVRFPGRPDMTTRIQVHASAATTTATMPSTIPPAINIAT